MPELRRPFVIAESASTHGAQLDRLLEAVDVAKAADADAVKTQWASSAERVAERMHAPENTEMYRRLLCWPAEWLKLASDRAHAVGLEFMCTVDLPEDIAVVAPHVDRFKIASWGATDRGFISEHLRNNKPIVTSTGTWSFAAIAFHFVNKDYRPNHWLLQCTSSYPAPVGECNLAAIRALGFDGFSDHTRNVLTGAIATAAGARVLEVHYRLTDTPKDHPDYPVSLSPFELREYIKLARQAAIMLGDGIKKCQPSEEPNRRHRYVG